MCIQNETRQGKFYDRKPLQDGQFRNIEAPEKTLTLKLQQQKHTHVWCTNHEQDMQPTVRADRQPTAILMWVSTVSKVGKGSWPPTPWLTVYFPLLAFQDLCWKETTILPFSPKSCSHRRIILHLFLPMNVSPSYLFWKHHKLKPPSSILMERFWSTSKQILSASEQQNSREISKSTGCASICYMGTTFQIASCSDHGL